MKIKFAISISDVNDFYKGEKVQCWSPTSSGSYFIIEADVNEVEFNGKDYNKYVKRLFADKKSF